MLHLKIIVIIVVILIWNVIWNIFKPAWMFLLKLLKKNIILKIIPISYWSLLIIFWISKKIPIIPPLFYENRFVTDFKEKAQLFNIFFSKQCSLPLFLIIVLFLLMLTILPTNVYLQLNFQPEILKKSFKILIQTKPMDVSIHMLKMGGSICVLLDVISKVFLLVCFPLNGK